MTKRQIIIILLWISFQSISGESISTSRKILQLDISHEEQPGFFSRIASWIFPFGGTTTAPLKNPNFDSKISAHPSPKYLPPPQTLQQKKFKSSIPPTAFHPISSIRPIVSNRKSSECNPCNQEPWIPIPGKSGRNAVIEFVQQKEVIMEGLNPPPPQYAAPTSNHNEYYGPPPVQKYGVPNHPPSPSIHPMLPNLYGPPAPQFKSKQIPSTQHNFNHHYLPVSQKNNDYKNIIGMRAPLMTFNLPKTHLNPVKNNLVNPHNIQDIIQPPVSKYSILDEDFPPYTRNPISDAPNVQGIEQIPLSSGDNGESGPAIAFPNLSLRPLVPIHNYVNFNQGGNSFGGNTGSVQILPSVPVADFVSSIEHPINIIQSPIVELNVRNSSSEDSSSLNHLHQVSTTTPYSAFKPNNVAKSGLFVNPSINKLERNPILVDEDSHVAASSNKEENSSGKTQFLHASSRENSDNRWTPTFSFTTQKSTYLNPVSSTISSAQLKRTKHVQIIIPYYNFNNNSYLKKNDFPFKSIYENDAAYTTLLPVYKPPLSTEQSVWSQFLHDLNPAPSGQSAYYNPPISTTQVYNIQDYLKDLNTEKYKNNELSFDILTFQKNIDDWTQQSFSKTTEKLSSNTRNILTRLIPAKKIPEEYFTTVPYDYTTIKPFIENNFLGDHEAAGSIRKENYKESEVENSLILDEITSTPSLSTTSTTGNTEDTTSLTTTADGNEAKTETKEAKSLWTTSHFITVSPVTREKIYIVTPSGSTSGTTVSPPVSWSFPPKIENKPFKDDDSHPILYEHPKFSIKIQDNHNETKSVNGSSTTKVIFSEWPHKINNLQTNKHPLFGLMGITTLTNIGAEAGENYVEINGHSRVFQDATSSIDKRRG